MRTTKQSVISSVCELYQFTSVQTETIKRIVDSCPDRRNYSTDVEFYQANAKWGGENQPICIGMALKDIFDEMRILNEDRTSLRARAIQFVQDTRAHDITIRTFMNIFDYWATGKDDWESKFREAAFAKTAFEVFEKFLVAG